MNANVKDSITIELGEEFWENVKYQLEVDVLSDWNEWVVETEYRQLMEEREEVAHA